MMSAFSPLYRLSPFARPAAAALAVALALGTGRPAPGAAPAGGGAALALQARAVFSAKCAACHGPGVASPRGLFGHVLDLDRLAADPDLVVPFRPEDSRLWAMIRDDEMPPDGSREGALTTEEKGRVRAWIAAGAPGVSGAPAASPRRSPSEPSPAPAANQAGGKRRALLGARLLRWLGKFHIPAVHFPIALLVAAALGELLRACLRSREPGPEVRFCVLLGSAGAVVAAGLGWLHADWAGQGPGLALHRWTGTASAAWAVGVAVLCERDVRRGARSNLVRVALGAGAALVGAAGHFGGALVHGAAGPTWPPPF